MSWVEDNPLQMKGLATATELIRRIAVNLNREEIDEDSMVAVSVQIDFLQMAITALSEANSASALDSQIDQLLSEN